MSRARGRRLANSAWAAARTAAAWQGDWSDPRYSTAANLGLRLVAAAPGTAGYSAGHPLAEPAASAALEARAAAIDAAFAGVTAAIEALAPRQFDEGFAAEATRRLADGLGIDVAPDRLAASWTRPLDLVALQAEAVVRVFARLVGEAGDRARGGQIEGEPAAAVIARWGFHAIDVSTCADGRVAGLLDHVLRVPGAVVTARRSHAGAMFPVAQSLAQWERIELGRLREGRPNPAGAGTRYLKIGVYHYSSRDPQHEGCAAHGSDDARAAGLLLGRLEAFAAAVERRHGAGDSVALLLVGMDTDTDAIRVHVPGPDGRIDIGRFVSSLELHTRTAALSREAAKQEVRAAVAEAAGTAQDDPATEGMRWFCGYLLKNNIAQVEAVRSRFGGAYPEAGHDERLIIIGDPVDDVQLRNLAFQAQMASLEEGAGDLDVGLRILGTRLAPQGLAVPVLVLRTHDAEIPGDEDRAASAALAMQAAIAARHASRGPRVLSVAAVRAAGGGPLRIISPALSSARPGCGCGGMHA
jgi:carboxysome shell carbonic anhydrase